MGSPPAQPGGGACQVLWVRVCALKGGETIHSQQLLLTVECEGRRGEIALPADVPVADLVPRLLVAAGVQSRPGERSLWVLARPDGEILPGNLTLAQCLIDGLRESAGFDQVAREVVDPDALAERGQLM